MYLTYEALFMNLFAKKAIRMQSFKICRFTVAFCETKFECADIYDNEIKKEWLDRAAVQLIKKGESRFWEYQRAIAPGTMNNTCFVVSPKLTQSDCVDLNTQSNSQQYTSKKTQILIND
ncbi:Hypothetical_protein [Hexamita inflata]|uniref:Hypothetical_protein n=1 Tax=Hexamita inflata TaxID=28002 RepID=A0AA86UGC3_9EUKA|nr:Hypothetical protein HINF_LOCUS44698 [Hexamita inflata]CAI9957055.1 Hypothetical protein HINF_LOCUS44700 [Hexamita inflata]